MKKPKIIKPCKKCPYKLGLIKFVRNPCPDCKANEYKYYYKTLEKIKNPLSENANLKIE